MVSTWEGSAQKKPWEYDVCVAIPVLNSPETIDLILELLRLQTIKPYILIIDTGSTAKNYKKFEKLRADDLEVHSIRLNGVRHPSDPVSMAMDMAFALCRSKYMFCTHNDCFLMRQNVLEEMVNLCKTKSAVVGHRLTPRAHEDWYTHVGHTCLMLDMVVMDRIGAGWSQRRIMRHLGVEDYSPSGDRENFPDTEVCLNYICKANGIIPYFTGTEENDVRNTDSYIDHCRSMTCGRLYAEDKWAKHEYELKEAMERAAERVELWKAS